MNWYAKKTGSGQALIIDEQTGDNIAVAYDPAKAHLLAAAPELLEALQYIERELIQHVDKSTPNNPVMYSLRKARAAIDAAS